MNQDRRHVLLGLVSAATAGAGAGRALLAAPGPSESYLRSAVLIGQRFLAAHPEERSLAALKEHVQWGRPDTDWKARVREDFWQGNTVEIDGWVLSCTEVRCCAIVSLLISA